MKNIQKLFLVAFATLLFVVTNAQNGSDYSRALGVKAYPGGISYKQFLSNKNNTAIEGLGYFWTDGMRITALYEIHKSFEGVEGLSWYYGPGAHIGFWNDSWKKRYPDRNASAAIGIDGVLGLDYKLADLPLNISVDWQPSFTITSYNYFEGTWGGIGIRYTF